jgi:hypothetical protein
MTSSDRTVKALLLAIAIGLWLHLVGDWMRPTPVHAQVVAFTELDALKQIGGEVTSIKRTAEFISRDTGGMKASLDSIALSGILNSTKRKQP